MTPEVSLWILFATVVVVMLVVDLALFNRRPHEIKLKEAVSWSLIWIGLALAFSVGVFFWLGRAHAMQFLTGYIIEKALSMDNLFVFLVIFRYFRVPLDYQHKVLFWGILGALAFRAVFIAAGVTLVQSLHWTMYVLGAFLIVTGIKLGFEKEKEIHPDRNIFLRLSRRWLRVTKDAVEGRFFVRRDGLLYATPLFVTLIVVESTDIVFATDSIPAILGITTDPFLVYSSNIFAILGLRALYFLLAGIMEMFRFLHHGLAIILVFVGAKMLFADFIHLDVLVELLIVAGILGVAILLSLLLPKREPPPAPSS